MPRQQVAWLHLEVTGRTGWGRPRETSQGWGGGAVRRLAFTSPLAALALVPALAALCQHSGPAPSYLLSDTHPRCIALQYSVLHKSKTKNHTAHNIYILNDQRPATSYQIYTPVALLCSVNTLHTVQCTMLHIASCFTLHSVFLAK